LKPQVVQMMRELRSVWSHLEDDVGGAWLRPSNPLASAVIGVIGGYLIRRFQAQETFPT